MSVVVSGDLSGEGASTGGQLLFVTLSLLLVQGCDRVSILRKTGNPGDNLLLGSTPPCLVFASLVASPRRFHSQSGYSESSLAKTSGLFLK